MDATRGPEDGRLDIVCGHLLDRCEERPLIGVRSQMGFDKDAETLLPWTLLQRQGDQVARHHPEHLGGQATPVHEPAVVPAESAADRPGSVAGGGGGA